MTSIYMITQFFPSPRGRQQTGGTISNLHMIRALGQHFDMTVLSFDNRTCPSDFADESFRVIHCPSPSWRASQLFRYWQKFVQAEVSKLIAQGHAPNAVIATTSTLAAFDAVSTKIKRIALVRAFENFGLLCPWVPFRQRINLGKLAAVRKFQDPKMMRKADAVFTNSMFMRTAIASRFDIEPKNIHVLTQSSNVSAADNDRPADTIGFVSRGREKGISIVLEIARRSPDLTYLVYGHNGDVPSILPPNVKWQGWASDRSAMFASAALWLVPSIWAEPFGRVSVEAQAANRAVLVAEHGGLPETVLDPLFRIQGFDPDAWLARIRELLRVPLAELEENGAKMRAAFSDEVHDQRLFEAIYAVLKA